MKRHSCLTVQQGVFVASNLSHREGFPWLFFSVRRTRDVSGNPRQSLRCVSISMGARTTTAAEQSSGEGKGIVRDKGIE